MNQNTSGIKMLQIFSFLLLFCIGGIVFAHEFFIQNNKEIVEIENETPEIVKNIIEIKPIKKDRTSQKKLPKKVTIAVPFYIQAPDNRWVLPWTEACSEANLVLAAYYIQDKNLTKDQFKKDIIAMTKIQSKFFDTYIEVPLIDLQKIYNRFYPNAGTTRIVENPTIEQIKEELAQGNIIISPSAGKKLNNPYYEKNAPRFHTILIRGYDEKYFYTNDVGISRGKNFPYLQQTIIDANHDLVDGDITQGAKRMLVISK